MPIHDYRCGQCNAIHDALVKADEVERECPECGSIAVRVFLKTPKLNYLAMGAQKNVSPEFQDKFDKMHRDRKEKEEKCEAEHGDYGPAAGA